MVLTKIAGRRLGLACKLSNRMIHRFPWAMRRATAVFAAGLCCALGCALAIAVLACPATAAELGVLRNGFSIRHEHRLVIGTTTRLFLSIDDSSFTDVPTADIAGFEKDLSLPVPVAADARV